MPSGQAIARAMGVAPLDASHFADLHSSILNQAPPFVPTLGSEPGQFRVLDLLRIAGVDQKR